MTLYTIILSTPFDRKTVFGHVEIIYIFLHLVQYLYFFTSYKYQQPLLEHLE